MAAEFNSIAPIAVRAWNLNNRRSLTEQVKARGSDASVSPEQDLSASDLFVDDFSKPENQEAFLDRALPELLPQDRGVLGNQAELEKMGLRRTPTHIEGSLPIHYPEQAPGELLHVVYDRAAHQLFLGDHSSASQLPYDVDAMRELVATAPLDRQSLRLQVGVGEDGRQVAVPVTRAAMTSFLRALPDRTPWNERSQAERERDVLLDVAKPYGVRLQPSEDLVGAQDFGPPEGVALEDWLNQVGEAGPVELPQAVRQHLGAPGSLPEAGLARRDPEGNFIGSLAVHDLDGSPTGDRVGLKFQPGTKNIHFGVRDTAWGNDGTSYRPEDLQKFMEERPDVRFVPVEVDTSAAESHTIGVPRGELQSYLAQLAELRALE